MRVLRKYGPIILRKTTFSSTKTNINSSSHSAILKVKNAGVRYGPTPVFHGLSFKLTEPCFLALVGNNGSGKTTLLKALAGEISHEGSIIVFGENIRHSYSPTLMTHLSFLHQQNTINFDIPAEELAVMGRFRFKRLFENYTKEDYERVKEVFQLLRISFLYGKNIRELSGGEQQMVWLAQTLLCDTDVFLLDEPTQSLDLRNKKIFYDIIKQLINQKKTVVCTTHDLEMLKNMEGFLINMSFEHPTLIPCTPQTVSETMLVLMNA